MYIIFLTSFLLFSANMQANADCVTGYACSIEDLKQQEHKKLLADIEIYKKYIEENKKDIVLTISINHVNYKDLFIFSSFV